MIEWVYRRARQARRFSRVVVLTDDQRIADAVEGFGGEVELTPNSCATGTDRIAYAANNWTEHAVVNVQGDEPLIDAGALDRVAAHLQQRPEDRVVTLAAPGRDEDMDNPNVVKLVYDTRGYALYFSRAPIPFARRHSGWRPQRHIGVYGYDRDTLLAIAAAEPTPLELTESLEQLRMLENGIEIRVLPVDQAWPGVDTMEDLQRIEELLRGRPDLALA